MVGTLYVKAADKIIYGLLTSVFFGFYAMGTSARSGVSGGGFLRVKAENHLRVVFFCGDCVVDGCFFICLCMRAKKFSTAALFSFCVFSYSAQVGVGSH